MAATPLVPARADRPMPALGALLGCLVLAAGLAGCLNDFDTDPMNRVLINGIDVSAPEVGSGRVTLVANVTIENREADSGSLSLTVKAHNTATGLLVATVEAEVGRIDRDRNKVVPVPLGLPKEDGYRITAILFQDDERKHQAVVQVSQVEALAVNIVDTGLAVRDLEFLVRNVSANQVRIETQVYLTNEGGSASDPLRLQLKAREVSTGLLADEEWTEVAAIALEATRIHSIDLEVPDGYNYLVEAVLWAGDFMVGQGQGKVQLLPTFTVPKDEQIVVDRPVVEDFIRGDASAGFADDGHDSEGEATPGPGVLLVLFALAAAVLWTRRRK